MSGAQINKDRLFHLFEAMVDCYSPSGKEEDITALLKSHLIELGLPVEIHPISDTRSNILLKGSPQADVLFLGHIDTVPAFDIEKYGFSFEGGICYGLGTADMKGGCAALLEAFCSQFEHGDIPASAVLALVVGEEEAGDGTAALLESYKFSSALVAEPTELKPALKHYGYIEMLVRAFGYRRHAAMSDSQTNAIRAMLRSLLAMEEFVEKGSTPAVLNIRDLNSSEAGFAVPDRCSAVIDIHIPPEEKASTHAERLQNFMNEKLTASGATRVEIDFPTLAEGFSSNDDQFLASRLRQATDTVNIDWQDAPFRSHSDANLLHDTGCETILFGPGQLSKAHTRDESVEFDQVLKAAEVYRSLLNQLEN